MADTVYTIMAKHSHRQGWDESTERDLALSFIAEHQLAALDAYLAQIAGRERRWTNAEIGPIERLIDCVPLENLKSWIVNMLTEMRELSPVYTSKSIADEYVTLLQPLAGDGAKIFESWHKCPDCGEDWDDAPGGTCAEVRGDKLQVVCWNCEATITLFFRLKREPVTDLPF